MDYVNKLFSRIPIKNTRSIEERMDRANNKRLLLNKICYLLKDDLESQDCFVECGVKIGFSASIISKMLGIKTYLFDTWLGHRSITRKDYPTLKDLKSVSIYNPSVHNHFNKCYSYLRSNNDIGLFEFIKGDIIETVPKFSNDHKDLQISCMHLDTDLYLPTKISLQYFYPYVKEGGLVIFHDHGKDGITGINRCVEEFLSDHDDLYFHDFESNFKLFSCLVKGKNSKSKSIIKTKKKT